MNITSNFVLLDVRGGKEELRDHFADRRVGPCMPELHLPVTIHGYIYGPIGHDDGESIEFGVDVLDVKIEDARPNPSAL